MADSPEPVAEISSPCIRHCCLNQHDYCVGCKRHLEEILHWRALTEEQRQQLMLACKTRDINLSTN